MPSRAIPGTIAAKSWARAWRSDRSPRLGLVLRWHVQVGPAAPQARGEGDPDPGHPGGFGGDAPVIAKAGRGAVYPYIVDCRGGNT